MHLRPDSAVDSSLWQDINLTDTSDIHLHPDTAVDSPAVLQHRPDWHPSLTTPTSVCTSDIHLRPDTAVDSSLS